MKNKWIGLAIILLVAITLWAFRYFKPVEEIDLGGKITVMGKKYLDANMVFSKFPLCEVLPVEKYDKVLVVHPYAFSGSFEKFNIQNLGGVMKALGPVKYNDGHWAFIYMKDSRAEAYSIITVPPVDLLIPNKGVYAIDRSMCNNIYARKFKNGYYQIFIKGFK